MGVAAASSTEPDAKKVARYRRLFGLLVVLGMLPVYVAWQLMDTGWADRRVQVQWVLAGVAFVGALYLVCLLVFPWSRPLWLQANLYQPEHWWGYLLPLVNTAWIAAWVTLGFAVVTAILHQRGVVTATPADAFDEPWFDASSYYLWSLAEAIPVLEIPQTIGWELGFRFTDRVTPVLLLFYKLALIGPLIAVGTLMWRDARQRRRSRPPGTESRGGGSGSPVEQ